MDKIFNIIQHPESINDKLMKDIIYDILNNSNLIISQLKTMYPMYSNIIDGGFFLLNEFSNSILFNNRNNDSYQSVLNENLEKYSKIFKKNDMERVSIDMIVLLVNLVINFNKSNKIDLSNPDIISNINSFIKETQHANNNIQIIIDTINSLSIKQKYQVFIIYIVSNVLLWWIDQNYIPQVLYFVLSTHGRQKIEELIHQYLLKDYIPIFVLFLTFYIKGVQRRTILNIDEPIIEHLWNNLISKFGLSILKIPIITELPQSINNNFFNIIYPIIQNKLLSKQYKFNKYISQYPNKELSDIMKIFFTYLDNNPIYMNPISIYNELEVLYNMNPDQNSINQINKIIGMITKQIELLNNRLEREKLLLKITNGGFFKLKI